jgi:GNAT superfamily N-acetyltransferase
MSSVNLSHKPWVGEYVAPHSELGSGDPVSSVLIELGDARRLVVSPVQPGDSEAERAFVGELSLESRYRRFHFGLRELSPEASRAMTEIDQHHHVAYVARPVHGDNLELGEIVADARYVMRADSAEAEFAIAVADAWQGVGLGRELLLLLSAHAKAHGVTRLFGDVLWGNGSMIGLVRSLGGRLRRNPGDATVVRAEFAMNEDVGNELVASGSHRLSI